MKFMIDPNNPTSSANDQAGSEKDPATDGAGKSGNVNYEAMYKELETKLGKQGRELGEYRTFFEGISPILDKLDTSPELVKAIVGGNLDNEIARAAMDGRLSVGDIKKVEKAHAEVKRDLGKKYDSSSADEISSLVEQKIGEVEKKFENTIREKEELRDFESRVNDFIEKTPDFQEYATEIEAWLDGHKNINDIEVAYYAVKGQTSVKEASQRAELERAEYAKEMALNAGGGGSKATHVSPGNEDFVDSLISSKSNPNLF